MTRKRRPAPIDIRLPPPVPEPDERAADHGFAWLFFLAGMQQHQVDALRFGVDPFNDAEWRSFVQWYRLRCRKPPTAHNLGTVFPLDPDELRDRLRRH